ncbi:MAG: hypothetical protein RR139_05905 [Lachnospiraceae bacterium]
MWYGKMTGELEILYDEYYNLFGVDPDGYQEVEYGQTDYNHYVKDIKTSIKEKKKLPNVIE